MLTERNSPEGTIDYPKGGTGAIVDALIRGLHKYGGRMILRAHADEIIMEGKAALHSGCLFMLPSPFPYQGWNACHISV